MQSWWCVWSVLSVIVAAAIPLQNRQSFRSILRQASYRFLRSRPFFPASAKPLSNRFQLQNAYKHPQREWLAQPAIICHVKSSIHLFRTVPKAAYTQSDRAVSYRLAIVLHQCELWVVWATLTPAKIFIRIPLPFGWDSENRSDRSFGSSNAKYLSIRCIIHPTNTSEPTTIAQWAIFRVFSRRPCRLRGGVIHPIARQAPSITKLCLEAHFTTANVPLFSSLA